MNDAGALGGRERDPVEPLSAITTSLLMLARAMKAFAFSTQHSMVFRSLRQGVRMLGSTPSTP
jgi:hypothetical protein